MSLDERKVVCTNRESWEDTQEKYVELSFSQTPNYWERILSAIKRCNFLGWRHDYNSHSLWGSLFWGLEIKQKDAPSIMISGCADYPEEWDVFMGLISECINMKEQKVYAKSCMKTIELPLKLVQAGKLAKITKLEMEQINLQRELDGVLEFSEEEALQELEYDERQKRRIEKRLKEIENELEQLRNT